MKDDLRLDISDMIQSLYGMLCNHFKNGNSVIYIETEISPRNFHVKKAGYIKVCTV